MKHSRSGIVLFTSALFAGSFALAADASSNAGGISTDQRTREVTPNASNTVSGNQAQQAMQQPVVIIVPTFFANDVNLANGCWARLYDGNNYRGKVLALTGPIDIPNMEPGAITGAELFRNFDSVLVGPKATLTVWDNNDYEDKMASFKPGARVPDLGSRTSYFSEIHSLKLSCSNQAGGGAGSGSQNGGAESGGNNR